MSGLTLNDLIQSDKAVFTPAEISGVLGSDPQTIRVCARQRPAALGFPVIVTGSRVKIPRIPFLRYMGAEIGGENEKSNGTVQAVQGGYGNGV